MKRPWKKYKRNIPHRIRVNAKTEYEILYTDDFKDGKTRGESRLDLKQIVLLNNQTPRDMVETLFHEYLHAISDEFMAGLTEPQVLALEQSLPYLIDLINILQGTNNAKKTKQ